MPKRTKRAEEKTPADITTDKSERLAHHDATLVVGGKPTVIESQPATDRVTVGGVTFVAHGEPLCRICGSRMATEVCPVDGFRSEGGQ